MNLCIARLGPVIRRLNKKGCHVIVTSGILTEWKPKSPEGMELTHSLKVWNETTDSGQ